MDEKDFIKKDEEILKVAGEGFNSPQIVSSDTVRRISYISDESSAKDPHPLDKPGTSITSNENVETVFPVESSVGSSNPDLLRHKTFKVLSTNPGDSCVFAAKDYNQLADSGEIGSVHYSSTDSVKVDQKSVAYTPTESVKIDQVVQKSASSANRDQGFVVHSPGSPSSTDQGIVVHRTTGSSNIDQGIVVHATTDSEDYNQGFTVQTNYAKVSRESLVLPSTGPLAHLFENSEKLVSYKNRSIETSTFQSSQKIVQNQEGRCSGVQDNSLVVGNNITKEDITFVKEDVVLLYNSKEMAQNPFEAPKVVEHTNCSKDVTEGNTNNNNNIDKSDNACFSAKNVSVHLKVHQKLLERAELGNEVPYSKSGAANVCLSTDERNSGLLYIKNNGESSMIIPSDVSERLLESEKIPREVGGASAASQPSVFFISQSGYQPVSTVNQSDIQPVVTDNQSGFHPLPTLNQSGFQPVPAVNQSGFYGAQPILTVSPSNKQSMPTVSMTLYEETLPIHISNDRLSFTTATSFSGVPGKEPIIGTHHTEYLKSTKGNLSKDNLSPAPSSSLDLIEEKGGALLPNHHRRTFDSLTPSHQLQVERRNNIPFSAPIGKDKDTTFKKAKKSGSKSAKGKSQKVPLLPADDEDDDNDFIPVGMLQLPAVKAPEGCAEITPNSEIVSVGACGGSQYPLNVGLNVVYKKPSQVSDVRTFSVEKPALGERNEGLQEKLKHKLQQQKLKSAVGVDLQQAAQLQQSIQLHAHNLKDLQDDVQQQESNQQHQLLLHLVQHAKQQQKHFQDHQQELQSQQSLSYAANSTQANPAGFHRNQGLVIHHLHSQDVKVGSSGLSSSVQANVKGHLLESEQKEDRQFKTEQKLEGPLHLLLKKEHKKNADFDKVQKHYHEDLKIVQTSSTVLTGDSKQSNTGARLESPWNVYSFNTPKIAERLLQQSLNEDILQQSASEQMPFQRKEEHLTISSPHQVNASKVVSRPITPTVTSPHNTAPSLNQQHPEIARMLSSPVSPRQPASPRQSLSPRGAISPIQSSLNASQLASPRQAVTSHQRQSSSKIRQSSNTVINLPLSKQSVSSQSTASWQSSSPANSSANPNQHVKTTPFLGKPISAQLAAEQRLGEQSRIDLNQSTLSQFNKPQFPENNQQLDTNKVRQVNTDGQYISPGCSVNISSGNTPYFNSSKSTPISHFAQSFSPNQVIHHRPPESRSIQDRIQTMQNSQSSTQNSQLSVHFSPQAVTSTKVSLPSINTTSSVWQALPSQAKPETSLLPSKDANLQSSEAVTAKILAQNNQNKGAEKPALEMHLYTTVTHVDQPISKYTDTIPKNFYTVPNAHENCFQSIANLTEKETSLIQSLFADNSCVHSEGPVLTNASQATNPGAQESYNSSTESPKKGADNLRIFSHVVSSYPELRKNEGGLKVLSEIASERYELAVAGKEDLNERQNYAQKDQTSSETSNQLRSPRANQTASVRTKPSSSEKSSTSVNKSKTSLSFETKSSEPGTHASIPEIEANDNPSDSPKREVRTRKPKKPFEQEEPPVTKRNLNASRQKNISTKNQTETNPPPKRSHKKGQGLKSMQAKKEAAERENLKLTPISKTRSSSDDKSTEIKNKDSSEDIEDTDQISRRLSQRLQEKEKELSEQKSAENVASNRVSRQTAKVHYKEDTLDLVEDSFSTRSTRSSQRASIPHADDVMTSETSVRMTTRSKNRSEVKSTAKSENTNDNHKQKLESSCEKSKLTDTPKTSTPKAGVVSHKKNTRDTKMIPGSPVQKTQLLNSVIDNATPERRIITRQVVAELKNLGSGTRAKNKRPAPPEFEEELPPGPSKRTKQSFTWRTTQESSKASIIKFEVKEEASKEVIPTELNKEMTKSHVTAPIPKSSENKKQSHKKKVNSTNTTLMGTKDNKRSAITEGENTSILSKDVCKEESNFQESKLVSSVDITKGDSKNTPAELEATITHNRDAIFIKQGADKNSKKITKSMNKNEVNESKLEHSDSEKPTDGKLMEAVRTEETKSVEKQSVIKSTTTLLSSSAQVRGIEASSLPSQLSAEAASSQSKKSYIYPALSSDRQKMVMFRLVPVLEEEMPDLKEPMIPVSGYFVPGGSSDLILLRENFRNEPATIKVTSAAPRVSMPPVTVPQTSSAPLQVFSSCEGTNQNPASLNKTCTSIKTVTTSTVTLTVRPLPATLSVTQPASVVLKSVSSNLSAQTMPSVWTPHPPNSAESNGEPSSQAASRKSWTSTPSQSTLQQYKQPWNATPQSMPLSSLPTSSSTWNASSSSVPPLQLPQRELLRHTWSSAPQRAAHDSPWSSSPSVTVAAVESWSKEFFPNTIFTSTTSLRDGQAEDRTHSQQVHSTPQNMLQQQQGYSSMEVSSSQQAPIFTSTSQDHTFSSSTLYNAGASQDSEFTDSRQDSVIQGFLKHVSSNPGGFSQELAGFNLGQQDLAYLESRLRQTLSPSTLFSAVQAYEDTNGHGTIMSHDSSLHESINLVHTVNLDLEEGNLDSSANLDLSDLGGTVALGLSRSFGGHGTIKDPQVLDQADNCSVVAKNAGSSSQQELAETTDTEPKNDAKKLARERKSQYEVIKNNDVKKYRCLVCDKCFGVTTIYRHLRTHDPDYKISCSLCGKQYTQRSSLAIHWKKNHGDQPISSAGVSGLNKSPRSDQEALSQEKVASVPLKASVTSFNVPLKSSEAVSSEPLKMSSNAVMMSSSSGLMSSSSGLMSAMLKSPLDSSELTTQLLIESRHYQNSSTASDGPLPSPDKSGLSKQQAAHQQVEELRKLKAEKKLAAVQRKTGVSDGVLYDNDPFRSISNSEGSSDKDTQNHASNATRITDSANNVTDLSSFSYPQTANQNRLFQDPISISSPSPDMFRKGTHSPEDYETHLMRVSLEVSNTKYNFNLSHPAVSTVPQFHADNIPKPISTPGITSSLINEADSQKESTQDSSPHLKDGEKYICEVCHTQLNSRNGYLLHKRRHNNIKTKFCSYCNKDFHTTQELRSHERTHTGERPYKCEICHTTFAHSGSFVSHKKSHEKRGEKEAFPVIDGEILYPPSFKKPRLSIGADAGGENPRVKKSKPKKAVSETANSEHLSQQTSVIRKGTLEAQFSDPANTPQEENLQINVSGRLQSLKESYLSTDTLRSSLDSPDTDGHNFSSNDLRMGKISQKPESRGYSLPENSYSPSLDKVEYYSAPTSYRQSIQQELMPPNVDPASHDFYKHKFYERSSEIDSSYSMSRLNQNISMPVNLAVEKSQFSGSQSFSDSGQGSVCYSPLQQSSDYHYVPSQSVETEFSQEDSEEYFAHYKNDPSSTEIVKKLLQHYNVPSSPFPEIAPLDYSHQIQVTPEYSRTGHSTVSEYSNLGAINTPPAPPSYSASISSQQKQLYLSKSISSDYDSNITQQMSPVTQDQPLSSSHQHGQSLVQSPMIPDRPLSSFHQHQQSLVQSPMIPDRPLSSSHQHRQSLVQSPMILERPLSSSHQHRQSLVESPTMTHGQHLSSSLQHQKLLQPLVDQDRQFGSPHSQSHPSEDTFSTENRYTSSQPYQTTTQFISSSQARPSYSQNY